MKQLTNNMLKMVFAGIDLALVSKVEFAFSQEIGSPPMKTDTYPGETTSLLEDNAIGVAWTPEETSRFVAGRHFYADARITLRSSPYQPETLIVKLMMNPTLFREG